MKLNVKILIIGISTLLGIQTNVQAMESVSDVQKIYTSMIKQSIENGNIEDLRRDLATGIKRGFDINAQEDFIGLINRAIMKNNAPIVKLLLEAGASPRGKNSLGFTPLYMAIMYNNLGIVNMLIDAGADVNEKSRGDQSPIVQAIKNLKLPLVKVLLNAPGTNLFEQEEGTRLLALLQEKKPQSEQEKIELQEMINFLKSHCLKLTELSMAAIINNMEYYKDKLDVLPEEIRNEVNLRLKQKLEKPNLPQSPSPVLPGSISTLPGDIFAGLNNLM